MNYRKRGTRHEHRIVAEQMLGRALHPGEIVHHINHNKMDNRPENLQVMTQSEHARLHFTEIAQRRPLAMTCKFGHALEAGNILITSAGRRRCLICARKYDNEWRKAQRRARGLQRPGPKPGVVKCRGARGRFIKEILNENYQSSR